MAKQIKLYKSYAGSAQDYKFIIDYFNNHGGLPDDFKQLSKVAVIKKNDSERRRGQDYVLAPGKFFYMIRKGTLDERAARLRSALAAELAGDYVPDMAERASVSLEQVALQHGNMERVVIKDVVCGLTAAVSYHEARFDGQDLDVKVYNSSNVLLDSFEAGSSITPLCEGFKTYSVDAIVKAVQEFGHIDFGKNAFDLELGDEADAAALVPTYKEKRESMVEKMTRESYVKVLDANSAGLVALKELLSETLAARSEISAELKRKDEHGYPLYPRGCHERGDLMAKSIVLDDRAKLIHRTIDKMQDLNIVEVDTSVPISGFLNDLACASLTCTSAGGMVFIDNLDDLKTTWGYSFEDLKSLRDEVAFYGLDAYVDVCCDPQAEGKDYVVATWDVAGSEIRNLQAAVGEYSWAAERHYNPRPSIEKKIAQSSSLYNAKNAQSPSLQQGRGEQSISNTSPLNRS